MELTAAAYRLNTVFANFDITVTRAVHRLYKRVVLSDAFVVLGFGQQLVVFAARENTNP